MDEQEWKKLLKTYKTPNQTLDEVLEGVVDHLETPCQTGEMVTRYERNQYTGVGPIQTPAMCNRGTSGCNLFHDELQALRFTRLGLEHLAKQLNGLQPLI